MIRLLLLITVLFSAIVTASAQDVEKGLIELLHIKDTDTLYDKSYVKKTFGKSKYKLERLIVMANSYDYGIRQETYQLKEGRKQTEYHLTYLKWGKNIIYSELYKYATDDKRAEVVASKYRESKQATLLKQRYEKDYGVALSFRHIHRAPNGLDNVFGFRVGYLNKMPPAAEQMLALVNSNDAKALQEMLVSINASYQAYGLTGLAILKRRGRNLNIEELAKNTRARNITVWFVEGCVCCDQLRFNELLDNYLIEENIQRLAEGE